MMSYGVPSPTHIADADEDDDAVLAAEPMALFRANKRNNVKEYDGRSLG